MTEQDPKVFSACESMQGKIYSLYEDPAPAPPLHPNCRCQIEVMKSVIAGFGTKDSVNGADWWLKHNGKLPDYYNENGHLPSAPDRIWHEADINYYEGQRNKHRIVWSNDGLIFVTYDHYHTFYEIT